MTTKEKAEDLIIQFWELDLEPYKQKKCALIAVDEILLAGKDVDEFADAYWQEVKQHIQRL